MGAELPLARLPAAAHHTAACGGNATQKDQTCVPRLVARSHHQHSKMLSDLIESAQRPAALYAGLGCLFVQCLLALLFRASY